jgi:hypothetical protein
MSKLGDILKAIRAPKLHISAETNKKREAKRK